MDDDTKTVADVIRLSGFSVFSVVNSDGRLVGLSRGYQLITQLMGIKTVQVVDVENRVVGIVSRQSVF